jgi:hypothetical protein
MSVIIERIEIHLLELGLGGSKPLIRRSPEYGIPKRHKAPEVLLIPEGLYYSRSLDEIDVDSKCPSI